MTVSWVRKRLRRSLKSNLEGLFITFEGGEGAGKTTLIEKVFFHLSSLNYTVLKVREPGGTLFGEKIRALLLDHEKTYTISSRAELALFLASRAQHVEEIILPALTQKKVVLCDRFNDSSLAYQGYARGLGEDEVRKICHFFSHELEPSLTFYLDVDPQTGLERAKIKQGHDRIEAEGISFHEKIRKGYLSISTKEPKRFVVLDATASSDEVFLKAKTAIDTLFSKC